MKKFGFLPGNRFKKRKNIETSLIRLICLLLILLFISVIFLYYSSMQGMYSEQLKKSNDSVIQQVAISFEAIMKQITDSIYKIPLYDYELILMIRNNNQGVLQQSEIYKKLDSIILGNDYLYSSYLFMPGQNIVLSSEYGRGYPPESFPDKEVISAVKKERISVLDPRLVETNLGRKLLISVVSPMPLSSLDNEGVLVVNIDAGKLYYNILKKINAEENMDFLVLNRENTIILNKNEALLFKKNAAAEQSVGDTAGHFPFTAFLNSGTVIHSSYYSKNLDWNFVLNTTIKSTSNFLTKLYNFMLYFIILLLLSLLVIIWIVKYSTKPMKKVLSNYNEKLWRDFLTDNHVDADELQRQLSSDGGSFAQGGAYAAITLQILNAEVDQNHFHQYLNGIRAFAGSMPSGYNINIIAVDKNLTALIVHFQRENSAGEDEHKLSEYAGLLYNSLDASFKAVTYIGVSSSKDSIHLLPMAYRECIESLNYKIVCNSHVLPYSSIKDRKLSYEYPYELEKQLINNLIVGNPEACKLFLDKFFEKLTDLAFCLSDSEIKNYVYQLQTSILRNISGLPISVKIDTSLNILYLFDLQEIKTKVLDFAGKIILEVNSKDENEELSLVNKIMEYFEKRYVHEDFNLNTMAEDLNLNRNYLAKIIREKTGNSFNDYTTAKRILLAKSLLQDKQIMIDDIAHKVGYNSANYFIKVFKSIEGVTPGQYRDKTGFYQIN